MSVHTPHGVSLCVVDPNSVDYDSILHQAVAAEIAIRFFGRAGEALRPETDDEWLWIVNARLPDLSGFELCEMLRRPPRAGSIVCIVSDEYSPEDERRARCSGASVYTGKPLPSCFVSNWLASLGPRASPLFLPTPAVASDAAAVLPPRSEGSRRSTVAARMPRRSSTPGSTTTTTGSSPCEYSLSRTDRST